MTGTLYLGTIGFAYDQWKGVFYPAGLSSGKMLPFYSSRFSSVEINYTFRRDPSERTITNWRSRTPDGFQFALKAPQRITHWYRLAGPEDQVATFLSQVEPLAERLGPVLFQCPPNLQFDRDLLEAFTRMLPDTRRFAMEFRHSSWEDARAFLAERGVAWCSAETDTASIERDAWDPFGYLRLRKESYSDDELKAWADRVGTALSAGRDVYCYFKHEDRAASTRWAERLAELTAT